MNLIYNLTRPAWSFYKWVSGLLGLNPLRSKLWAHLVIGLAWIILAGVFPEVMGWDAYDYDNDAAQLGLTIYGIIWFLFGVYLWVGIYIHKLRVFEKITKRAGILRD